MSFFFPTEEEWKKIDARWDGLDEDSPAYRQAIQEILEVQKERRMLEPTIVNYAERAAAEAPICCGRQMIVSGNVPITYRCPRCASTAAGRPEADPEPAPQPATPEGPAVTQSATSEHNTAALKRILTAVGADLAHSTDLINRLASRSTTAVALVADAGEFAVATQQTAQSRQALDETNTLTTVMDQHLGTVSSTVVAAEGDVTVALRALRAVDLAEDALLQAGAGPKSVAPARDGA